MNSDSTKGDAFTIGMLIAFQMYASKVSQPMLRLVGLWQLGRVGTPCPRGTSNGGQRYAFAHPTDWAT